VERTLNLFSWILPWFRFHALCQTKTIGQSVNFLRINPRSLATSIKMINQSLNCSQRSQATSEKMIKESHRSNPRSPTSIWCLQGPITPREMSCKGQMLELNDDHETRQVFIEKKMLPDNFVGNNLVLQVEQDIACRCCLKKTSLVGFYSHTRLCYLYCFKYGKLEQFKGFTGSKKKYMNTYNKSEKVVEKANVKYLANKKTYPFGEAPLWIPDTSVSSILCYTLLYYNCNFISWSFLPFKSLWFPVIADYRRFHNRAPHSWFIPTSVLNRK
jgi:hypothetical protein